MSSLPKVVHARKVQRDGKEENGQEKVVNDAANKLKQADFSTHAPTRAGTRNQQDSSFALSGAQYDDDSNRSSSRVLAPPGGGSRGLW